MPTTFDPAEALRRIEELRRRFAEQLSEEEREALRLYRHVPSEELPEPLPGALYAASAATALRDFDMVAVIDGLERMCGEIRYVWDRRMAALYEQALEVYYAAEALARDPARADLLPQLEEMRAAHERDYGRPIPPRDDK